MIAAGLSRQAAFVAAVARACKDQMSGTATTPQLPLGRSFPGRK
jgi:hypothetical protein